jgi:hypothetical protein
MRFHIDLEQLRKQAKERVRDRRAAGEQVHLSDVQFQLAVEQGFASWPGLVAYVEGTAGPPERGRRVAASPVEALDELAARGLMGGGPSGRHTVTRSHVTLTRIGQPPAPPRPPERVEVEGPMFTVDPGSVEVVKHREVDGRHLFAVRFEVTANAGLGGRTTEQMSVVVADRAGEGWRAFRGGGIPARVPARVEGPAVRLGQHWSADSRGFSAGARVVRGEADVANVRLRFADGVELVADVDLDVALFFRDVALGTTTLTAIELCDSAGTIVATEEPRHIGRREPGIGSG